MRSSSLLLLLAPTTMSFGGPLREIKDPNTYSALVFVPPGADGPMPLLLYLHGAGESGTSVRDLISEGATGTQAANLRVDAANSAPPPPMLWPVT